MKRRVSATITALAFFYCDGNVQEKQDPRVIFGSILKQLLCQTSLTFESSELTPIKEFFKQCKDKIFRTRSSTEIFLSHIITISSLFAEVFIIIDGIDECDATEERLGRKDILYLLTTISVDKIHIFVTSRRQNDIEEAFSGRDSLAMEVGAVMSDIASHIDSRLKDKKGLMNLDLPFKEDIKNSLLRKCDGM